MDTRRKRYLIASALVEYVSNEAGKPLELRRDTDANEMRQLLETEYADLLGVLSVRKTAGHRNLAGTIAVIEDDDTPEV